MEYQLIFNGFASTLIKISRELTKHLKKGTNGAGQQPRKLLLLNYRVLYFYLGDTEALAYQFHPQSTIVDGLIR